MESNLVSMVGSGGQQHTKQRKGLGANAVPLPLRLLLPDAAATCMITHCNLTSACVEYSKIVHPVVGFLSAGPPTWIGCCVSLLPLSVAHVYYCCVCQGAAVCYQK